MKESGGYRTLHIYLKDGFWYNHLSKVERNFFRMVYTNGERKKCLNKNQDRTE